jgi:Mrp family chromosome partitioning ATPase/DUF971 family protein
MDKQEQVLKQLSRVIDPDLKKDIVSLGFIKKLEISDDGAVSFICELTTPACPVKEQFKIWCDEAVRELDWVTDVTVTLSAQKRKATSNPAPGMGGVKHIVAVSSCKGGVGKSTVAVNLAFTLAKQGAAVGIFDADIYGPSLPTMVNAHFDGLYQRGQLIVPVEFEGVKLMSFAYASAHSGGGPAIMRGPMVSQIIQQLLGTTDWGELDYLIIDMPPGTGDIQLTLTQVIPLTAAVIVTTPQEISFIDVVKGIQMFDKLQVPTVAVVENMSYFVCGNCDERHEIFGRGAMHKLVEQFGFEAAFQLPLDSRVAELSDNGSPLVLQLPDSDLARQYNDLTEAVVREISKAEHGALARPQVDNIAGVGIAYKHGDEPSLTIAPAALRRACRCAHCVNEMTGEKVLRDEDVTDDIQPQNIRHLGNYAITCDWSDGHSSIYPYTALEEFRA